MYHFKIHWSQNVKHNRFLLFQCLIFLSPVNKHKKVQKCKTPDLTPAITLQTALGHNSVWKVKLITQQPAYVPTHKNTLKNKIAFCCFCLLAHSSTERNHSHLQEEGGDISLWTEKLQNKETFGQQVNYATGHKLWSSENTFIRAWYRLIRK